MIENEIVFNAGETVTPDIAAKIAQCASKYDARVYLCSRGVELHVDSLIGILSMNVQKGKKLIVKAEGEEAQTAINAVCDLLSGN